MVAIASTPVRFTQFLRPNGRQVAVLIDRPIDIATVAARLQADGWKFEVEELTTGEASFEICKEIAGENVTLAAEVVPNGPEVLAAVDRLILNAARNVRRLF